MTDPGGEDETPRSRPRRVLVLEHVAEEGPGALADALRGRDLDPVRIRGYAGDRIPPSAADLAGVVAMGGPMGVRDAGRLPHLAEEIALLADAVARGVPVLGVCLGSQLLAAALGAEITAAPSMELGFLPVALTGAAASDPLFGGLDADFVALHWHGDVFSLPPGAAPLASSEQTALQAFRAGERAYGMLFHLEIGNDALEAMLEAGADEIRGAGVSPATLRAQAARHLPEIARTAEIVFGRWADLAAGRGPA